MNTSHYADMYIESLQQLGYTPELINAFFIAGVKLLASQEGTTEQLAALVDAHTKLTRENK